MKSTIYSAAVTSMILISCLFAKGTQAQDLVETTNKGSINWTEQYIEATGMSVMDTERFKIPAQAQAMAQRGAVVEAQRNLLEIVKGVKVTSKTTVKDFITESDVIVSEIQGVIKGAQMVGKPVVYDGYIEVTLRMPLYAQGGLGPIMAKNMTSDGSGIADEYKNISSEDIEMVNTIGLALASGQKITPSMFPKFVDEDGNVLIDMLKAYDPANGNFPSFGKLTSSNKNNGSTELLDIAIDGLGNFVVSKIQKPKLKMFVKGLFTVGEIALKILL